MQSREAMREWRVAKTLWVGVALIGLLATTAWAQGPDYRALREHVEEQYEVIVLRDGLLLRPYGEAEVGAIELGDGDIALDGERVSRRELEDLLGENEADRLRPLADLEADELRALFGVGDPDLSPVSRIEELEELEALETLETLEDLEDIGSFEEEALEEALEAAQEAMRDADEATRDEIRARREEIRALEDEIRDRARDLRDESRHRRSYRRHTDARVVVGSPVHVGEDEETGEIISLGGSVTVDGGVLGEIVAIGGPVRINGEVDGDIVAVGGGVTLTSTADVSGGVAAIGGRLDQEPGARVSGEITEVNLFDGTFGPVDFDWSWWPGLHGWGGFYRNPMADLFGRSLKLGVFALIGALMLVIFRGSMDRVAARVAHEPWKSGAVGLTSLIFFIPALILGVILLCISIIGIPLLVLVPFAVLGFILVAFFGYLAVAYQLGRWSEERFGWSFGGPVVALVIGLLWLHGWGIMSEIVDVVDTHRDFAVFFSVMLVLFGFLLKLCAWSAGLGAVFLNRFGGPMPAAPAGFAAVPPGAPPPIPVDGSGFDAGPDAEPAAEITALDDAVWAEYQEAAEQIEAAPDSFFDEEEEPHSSPEGEEEPDRPDET